MKKLIAAATVLSLVLIGAYSYVLPQNPYCVYIQITSPSGSVLVLNDGIDENQLDDLMGVSRERVTAYLGSVKSKPTLIVWNDKEDLPFTANKTAMMVPIGDSGCIFVGPNGLNEDVIAHEMVHSEILNRIGMYMREIYMPTWLDEGVAMGVDGRSEYDWIEGEDSRFVRSLTNPWSFFSGDEKGGVTKHYAAAKEEVRQWLEGKGDEYLANFLDNYSGEVIP